MGEYELNLDPADGIAGNMEMIFMMFFGLILLALLIYGAYVYMRKEQPNIFSSKTATANSPSGAATRTESAMQILNERYARGEMSDEAYRRMKSEINKY